MIHSLLVGDIYVSQVVSLAVILLMDFSAFILLIRIHSSLLLNQNSLLSPVHCSVQALI